MLTRRPSKIEAPLLVMIVQPENKFRFRYGSEKCSHGGIRGKRPGNEEEISRKIYPTVKLENFHLNKPVFVRVSLYTEDHQPHVLPLVGKHARKDGMCYETLDESYCAKFTNLVIQNKRKEEVHRLLMERKIKNLKCSSSGSVRKSAEKKFEFEAKEEAKKILKSGVLCFEAFLECDPNKRICEPLFSDPIYDQKSTLRIVRMSRYSGTCKGGDEVILLCDKVKKGDIKVIFFEQGEDDLISWEGEGKFEPADVHHQVAIPFKTPRYKENVDKEVCVRLCQNNECSEPVNFLYTADDDLMNPDKKRKRCASAKTAISLFKALDSVFDGCLHTEMSQQVNEIRPILENPPQNFHSLQNASLPNLTDPLNTTALPNINSPSLYPEFSETKEDEVCNFESIPNCLEEMKEEGDVLKELGLDSFEKELSTYELPGTTDVFFGTFDQFETDSVPLNNKQRLRKELSSLALVDENYNTLLHMAVLQSRNVKQILKVIQILQVNIIDAYNKNKKTALHFAMELNNCDVIHLLCMNGANPGARDCNGNNCYHIAAEKNSSAALKVLSLHNTDGVNAFNYEGLTPLHIAVMKEFSVNTKECLRVLLQKADVNVHEKKSGKTPLHFAAMAKVDVIPILLEKKDIDVNSQDFEGNTPLHIAHKFKNFNAVKCLQAAGADFLLEDKESSDGESFDNPSLGVLDLEDEVAVDQMPLDVSDANMTSLLTMGNLQINATKHDTHSECGLDNFPRLKSVESEVCHLLDENLSQTEWDQIIFYLEISDIVQTAMKLSDSPVSTVVLKYLKKEFEEEYIQILKNILDMTGLYKALNLVTEILCA